MVREPSNLPTRDERVRAVLLKIGRVLGVIGGASGLTATLAVFVLPMYEGSQVTITSTGERIEERYRLTLLQAQTLEPVTIAFFSLMVIFSLVALLASFASTRQDHRAYGTMTLTAGIFLSIGTLLSAFSVGSYYLPGTAFVLVGGILLLWRNNA